MEWLDRQTYRLEDQHPPLARVAAALGPYLFGIRSPRNTGQDLSRQGAAILLAQGRLDRNLASARAGILPFFWIACVVVFLWARRILGSTGGLLALLLFTNVQPALAHAALATTDMALTGTLGAAVLSTLYWLENPSLRRTFVLGSMVGLAFVSKFSSIPFFIAAIVCMLLWHAFARARSLKAMRVRHLWPRYFPLAFARPREIESLLAATHRTEHGFIDAATVPHVRAARSCTQILVHANPHFG